MSNNFKILLVAAAIAAPAHAQQPQFQTPNNTPVQGVPAYAIPYATEVFRSISTVITVGNTETAVACPVQVVWYDWNNAVAGVSGPFVVAPGQTFEFTTAFLGTSQPNPPFIQNVFKSNELSFEGHAKVHVLNCPPTLRLRLNAQTIATDQANGLIEYKHIKVVRVPGNVGD